MLRTAIAPLSREFVSVESHSYKRHTCTTFNAMEARSLARSHVSCPKRIESCPKRIEANAS